MWQMQGRAAFHTAQLEGRLLQSLRHSLPLPPPCPFPAQCLLFPQQDTFLLEEGSFCQIFLRSSKAGAAPASPSSLSLLVDSMLCSVYLSVNWSLRHLLPVSLVLSHLLRFLFTRWSLGMGRGLFFCVIPGFSGSYRNPSFFSLPHPPPLHRHSR